MDLLQRIQRWYTINCNGNWEHENSITITNVDNPGWHVTINLRDTCLEHAVLPKQPTIERSSTNWVFWYVEEKQFIASGGPENLSEILSYFLDTFIPAHIDPESTLEIHLPVQGYQNQLWLKAEARMLSESTVEIISIADAGQAQNYKWGADADLQLFGGSFYGLTKFHTDYTLGDNVHPQVFQSEDNTLRTFLVAPAKS